MSENLNEKGLACILFVDDDQATNYLNKRLINRMGVVQKAVFCRHGREALDYLEATDADSYVRPNLIFLDINMPVMDGFEFLQAYESLGAEKRVSKVVVMLTTSLLTNDQQRAAGFGVTEYLDKPLTEEKVARVIADYFS